MLVRNKWNRQLYEVLEIENGKVTLRRADGSTFTIAEKEYLANYIKHYDNNICEK